MVWLWVPVVAIIGVPLLVTVIGLLLPERYEAGVSAVVDRPPEDVWAALTDVQKHPHGGRMCRAVEPLPDMEGRPAWVEDLGSSKVDVVTAESDRPRRLVRRLTDRVVNMSADVVLTLEPHGPGCRVVAQTRICIRRGTWHTPVFRVMLGLFGGARIGIKDLVRRVALGAGGRATFE